MLRPLGSSPKTNDAVQQSLVHGCGLDAGLPLVAGFSGGADSLCLLGLLAERGWKVYAAHFDHHLRAESGRDAERAGELARRLGVPFLLGEGDVGEYAGKEKLSIEEAARKLRYRFLFSTAVNVGAQAVCTAHTTDDQAETVLMNLLRGAGLDGLKGMRARTILPEWNRRIPLVRPLLGWTRGETQGWCEQHGLAAVMDPSNADLSYTRNRIRHELVPLLETYNPNIRRGLARTAAVLDGDAEIVAKAVEAAQENALRGEGLGWMAYDLGVLGPLDEGLLRGVLRQAVEDLSGGLKDVDYADIARAAAFARQAGAKGRIELAHSLRVFVEAGRLVIEKEGAAPLGREWVQMPAAREAALPAPGKLALSGGWVLLAERLAAAPDKIDATAANEAWLDAAGLPSELTVRPARAGERIRLLGMGGKSQKLSDFWVNMRVPRRARACYPLVWAGDEVVWAPGLRRSEAFRVTGSTQEVVHLKLTKDPA